MWNLQKIVWCVWRSMFLVKKYLQIDLPLWAWAEKTIHGVEAHRLTSKEKVPGTAVSKWDADSLLGDEETMTIDFLKKSATVKCFLLPTFNSPYWLNDLCIIISGYLGWCNCQQAWLANLHEWVWVSLGAPFIWLCTTSKQKT